MLECMGSNLAEHVADHVADLLADLTGPSRDLSKVNRVHICIYICICRVSGREALEVCGVTLWSDLCLATGNVGRRENGSFYGVRL